MQLSWPVFLIFIASSPAADMQPAIDAQHEFAAVCERGGVDLWHKSLCGPLILVDRASRTSVANQPDPDQAFRKEGDLWIGHFPDRFVPSNTSIEWNGQHWATVMLPLPTDRFMRIRLLAHESFHRIQHDLGLSAPDTPNAHLDTEDGRVWLRMELRALARALRSDDAAARQYAADAMLFRLNRHRLFPGSAEMEANMEKQEGLAEYTGTFVAIRVTSETTAAAAPSVEFFEKSDAFARSFAYGTGPALGLLLDRYAPDWRDRAASESLDALLIAALEVKPAPDLEQAAEARAAAYDYAAVNAAEAEREQRHQALLAKLTKKFLEGPTLQFPQSQNLMRNFDPQELVPFPPHGTYYPTGTFTAEWGKLEISSGSGALLAPDNMSLLVAVPDDVNARPVRGDGWTLDLAPGWTIRPAQRAGTFTIAPAPK